jgi:hypothetical protein
VSKATLAAHEKKVREARAAEMEEARLRELRRAVKSVVPKNVLIAAKPRKRGRAPVGGISRKEVAAMRAEAVAQLGGGDDGLAALTQEIQTNTLVMLKINGLLGTQPWRASEGPHGGAIPANARLRYVEDAIRILEDLRRSRGKGGEPEKRMLEGVIDAEIVK